MEKMGERLRGSVLEEARKNGVPLQVPQAGSMFALIFAEQPVRNFADADRIDTDRFNRLFHHALENGVYLPPSAFETCFISTAHTDDLLTKAADVISDGIRAL